ncbi:50S ribosomal protein L6 [Buchnera aphidicola (Thelaxes suberi)]|uniref:50S ribosomal protein L6 n=1 Tax=Buchnera aphidicola TaxID=9 RepID=UPI0034638C2B
MSRIAKLPIKVPLNVDVVLNKQRITIIGNKGTLNYDIHKSVKVIFDSNRYLKFCIQKNADNIAWSQAGTTRSLLFSMIEGVTNGYQKKLILFGVGYKAILLNREIHLSLGYSHIIKYLVPNDIIIEIPIQTEIIVKGIDKCLIGQVAANLRKFRIPELYKGKGIRYENEIIRIKEAKKK